MRVQLSPWDITETSIHLPSKRRRKRGAKDESTATTEFATATFAYGKRSRSSKKAKAARRADDVEPALIITSEHRIAVVGKNSKGSLQESDVMLYSSRPNRAAAFLSDATTKVNGKAPTKSPLKHVPAVFDVKNDQVYGLQNGNTRLVSWKALHGPDESISVKLDKPAEDLSILSLPSGGSLVYGTLQNGNLYLARSDDENLHVQYEQSSELPLDSCLVGTLAQAVRTNDHAKAGMKRKADTSEDDCIMVYQIFSTDQGIILVRHVFGCFSQNSSKVSRKSVQTASLKLIGESGSVEGVSILGMSDHQCMIFYSCRQQVDGPTNGSSGVRRLYCAFISFETANFVTAPVELPQETQQAVLVGSTTIAAGLSNEILFYDAARGGLIHRLSLEGLSADLEQGWSLLADHKRARLAILFAREDKFCVAMASMSAEILETRLTLAAGLASSIATGSVCSSSQRRFVSYDLTQPSSAAESATKREATIWESIEKLRRAFDLSRDGSEAANRPSLLLGTFESCVGSIINVEHVAKISGDPDKVVDNPQDAVLSRNGSKVNGLHHKPDVPNGVPKEKLINGVYQESTTRALTLKTIPQMLVDVAFTHTLEILLLSGHRNPVKEEAVVILKRLIHSGQVSARNHFGSEENGKDSFGIVLRCLEIPKGSERGDYSPVDFVFATLRRCVDISERQMVTMLHYMLCRALPFDIAAYFLRAKQLEEEHASRVMSQSFMELHGIDRKTKGKRSKKDEEQLEQLENKLVLAGATYLLQRMLFYSECNEALLRDALKNGLSRSEMTVMARLLVDLLSSTRPQKKNPGSRSYRAVQWMSALCDCLRGSVADLESISLSRVQEAVAAEVSKTETILSLQETLNQTISALQFSAMKKSEMNNNASTEKERSSSLPPYQIERLVF